MLFWQEQLYELCYIKKVHSNIFIFQKHYSSFFKKKLKSKGKQNEDKTRQKRQKHVAKTNYY